MLCFNYGGYRCSGKKRASIRKALTTFHAHLVVIQEHDAHHILEGNDFDDYSVIEDVSRSGHKSGLAFMARLWDKDKKNRCIHYYKVLASEEDPGYGDCCKCPPHLEEFAG